MRAHRADKLVSHMRTQKSVAANTFVSGNLVDLRRLELFADENKSADFEQRAAMGRERNTDLL